MAMRENINFARIFNCILSTGNKLDTFTKALGAAYTYPVDQYPMVSWLDPGGATRVITLPAVTNGGFMVVINTADAAEDLTLKDIATNTVLTVGQSEIGVLFSNGTIWRGFTGVL